MRWPILMWLLCGCVVAPVVDTEPPAPTYEELILARVEAAAEGAPYTLRHNPTDCRCPAFEIRLGDHWHRVELRADAPDSPQLQALLSAVGETDDQAGRTYRVDGTLDDELGMCGAGTYTVSMEPSEVETEDVMNATESAP